MWVGCVGAGRGRGARIGILGFGMNVSKGSSRTHEPLIPWAMPRNGVGAPCNLDPTSVT